MILHDHWCKHCGTDTEAMVEHDQHEIVCPNCGRKAQRYFKANLAPVIDASWLKSVHDVMDRDDRTPEAVEFRTHATRGNYKAWMKAKGIRPLEPGEERRKKPEVDHGKMVDRMMRGLAERRRIEI